MTLDDVKPDKSTYRVLFQAIILATALFAQGITIYAYMKTEIEKIAQVEAQKIVEVELNKRNSVVEQISLRITSLEMDKIRKDISIEVIEKNKTDIRDLKEQLRDQELLQETNFRSILKERRRIDALESKE